MSDARSDIGIDELRQEKYNNFLRILVAFLKSKGRDVRTSMKVIKAAEEVDKINGGSWSGHTIIANGFNERLSRLVKQDPKEWEKFLKETRGNNYFIYEELKKISPL